MNGKNRCSLEIQIQEQQEKIFQLKQALLKIQNEQPIKHQGNNDNHCYRDKLIIFLKNENQALKYMLKENEIIIAEFQHLAEQTNRKIEEILRINESLSKDNKKLKAELDKCKPSQEEIKLNFEQLQKLYSKPLTAQNKDIKIIPREHNDVQKKFKKNESTNNLFNIYTQSRNPELQMKIFTKNDKQPNFDLYNLNNTPNFIHSNSCSNLSLNNHLKCVPPNNQYNINKHNFKNCYY